MAWDLGTITGGSPASAVAALNPAMMVANVAGSLGTDYANWRQGSINRDWQQTMAGSAHQREVQDLVMAGLNPILSATGGRGAPTPSGNTMTMQDPIGPSINTALSARINKATVEKLQADVENTQSDTRNKDAMWSKVVADAEAAHWSAKSAEQDYQQSLAGAASARGIESIYNTPAGRIFQWINEGSRAIRGAGGAVRSVKP